jgi:hypothetical protein
LVPSGAEALDVGVGDLDTGCFETIDGVLIEHARAQADPGAGASCVRLSRFPHELTTPRAELTTVL